MWPGALNYNSLANRLDWRLPYGGCIIPFLGCADSTAKGYSPMFNVHVQERCIYEVYGCTSPDAINYDSLANVYDNSCIVLSPPPSPPPPSKPPRPPPPPALPPDSPSWPPPEPPPPPESPPSPPFSPSPSPPEGPCTKEMVVVNEIVVDGYLHADYIEIANAGQRTCSLRGWALLAFSKGEPTLQRLVAYFREDVMVGAREYALGLPAEIEDIAAAFEISDILPGETVAAVQL